MRIAARWGGLRDKRYLTVPPAGHHIPRNHAGAGRMHTKVG
jgi:hypothetical protein